MNRILASDVPVAHGGMVGKLLICWFSRSLITDMTLVKTSGSKVHCSQLKVACVDVIQKFS